VSPSMYIACLAIILIGVDSDSCNAYIYMYMWCVQHERQSLTLELDYQVKYFRIRVVRNVLWSKKGITCGNYIIWNMNVCGILPNKCCFLFIFLRDSPKWAKASSFTRFLDHTQRRTTVGKTHLDEWSTSSRDLYVTTHNTQNRQTSMPPVGFEPTISAGERPQTYVLDRAATGTGQHVLLGWLN
jgi:hypothetical protein